MQKNVSSGLLREKVLQASLQNFLFLQGRWSFASLQSTQRRSLWFLFEQAMNIPLELKWATFAMLCPTDQSPVPAPGSSRGPSWRSSCPRSCSASLCWSRAAWPWPSRWTVRCPGTARPAASRALLRRPSVPGCGGVVGSREEHADVPSTCTGDSAMQLSLIRVCCCVCVISVSYVLTSCLSNGCSKTSKRKTRSLPCSFL